MSTEVITLLDFYISTAPEPPLCFKPDVPAKPVMPRQLDDIFGERSGHPLSAIYVRNTYDNGVWRDKLDDEIPQSLYDEVKQADQAWDKYFEEDKKYELLVKTQAIVQWRIYYAQQMLLAKEKLNLKA